MNGPEITPTPSEEEVAAIMAAHEALWPKSVVAGAVGGGATGEASRWRFSGRWWSKPVTLRRDRPSPY
ncbi:MAG: hypothetical protein ACKV2O_16785 [Acidimicrobiales bacterium]